MFATSKLYYLRRCSFISSSAGNLCADAPFRWAGPPAWLHPIANALVPALKYAILNALIRAIVFNLCFCLMLSAFYRPSFHPLHVVLVSHSFHIFHHTYACLFAFSV